MKVEMRVQLVVSQARSSHARTPREGLACETIQLVQRAGQETPCYMTEGNQVLQHQL